MSSETDLSTADLAQPGGPQRRDRADDEQRRGGEPVDASSAGDERTYETSGNRVAEGMPDQGTSQQDTAAETVPIAGAGSTRDDVMSGRDMGDRGMADQGMADRDMGERGMGDRDTGDRGMAGQGAPRAGTAGGVRESAGGDVALLDPTDAEGFRQRWGDAQARFVDDPQEAVQTADGLVAEVMQTLASSFSEHKG